MSTSNDPLVILTSDDIAKLGHVLMTHETCTFCDNPPGRTLCPVCDDGWNICIRCGAVGARLEKPCPGERKAS